MDFTSSMKVTCFDESSTVILNGYSAVDLDRYP